MTSQIRSLDPNAKNPRREPPETIPSRHVRRQTSFPTSPSRQGTVCFDAGAYGNEQTCVPAVSLDETHRDRSDKQEVTVPGYLALR